MHRNDFYDSLQSKLTECLLSQVTDILGKLSFVQVGAADGVFGDPVYDMIKQGRWTGVLVDALKEHCERLKIRYAEDKAIKIVNSVVCDHVGESEFFAVVDANDLGRSRLSSMSYDMINKHKRLAGDIEEKIQIRKLRSDTLDNICLSNQVAQPDAIFVDAEGVDDIIIRSFDFKRFVPHIVFFEHMHIPVDRLMELNVILEGVGMQRVCLWADTIYISDELLEDECVRSVADAAAVLFKERDGVWGNGNWYQT